MMRRGTPALIAALICFCIYFGNVSLGAARKPVFLGDISEMLMLLLAVILFVIGVLLREAAAGPKPD